MKKFELPYNFDNDYFAFLNHYQDYFKYIKFIYLPAFKENGIENTRENGFGSMAEKENYHNYDKYVNIIKRFQSLNLDICILIQRNATLEIVQKYINEFNIKYFVINNDALAATLKELYGDKIYLILSITRSLTQEEIENTDLSMYDEIVLAFWFTRRLYKIKELPKKYNYTILVNCYCDPNCKIKNKLCNIHWFKNNATICKRKDNIIISPKDLIYYEDYIHSYKLVDRTDKSSEIFTAFNKYIKGYENLNNPDILRGNIDTYNLK